MGNNMFSLVEVAGARYISLPNHAVVELESVRLLDVVLLPVIYQINL